MKSGFFESGKAKQAFLVSKTAALGRQRRRAWSSKLPRLQGKTAETTDQNSLFCSAVAMASSSKDARTVFCVLE